MSRELSKRRRKRLQAIPDLLAAVIERRIHEGGRLRDDLLDHIPEYEEVAEAVVHSVGSAFEQRKVPHLVALLANIAFMGDTPYYRAHHLLREAESLTYRQLCLLQAYRRLELPKKRYLCRVGHDDHDLAELYPLIRKSWIIQDDDLAGRTPAPRAHEFAELLELPRAEGVADAVAYLHSVLLVRED